MKSTSTADNLPTPESPTLVNEREADAWTCEDCGVEVDDVSAHVDACGGGS